VSGRKIGLYGGTFDPIHFGHLVVAENCWAQLGLDEVLFVPAGAPPHKGGKVISNAADRIAMLERAVADNDHFAVSRVDVDRPGVSYSVDTVRLLQVELGPDTQLFFIIGGDSLGDLPRWRDPSQLIELCQVVAVNRPGYPAFSPERLEPVIPGAGERIRHLTVPALNIAASEIRRRVAAGQPIRYMVPDAVVRYIEERGLYRNAVLEISPRPHV